MKEMIRKYYIIWLKKRIYKLMKRKKKVDEHIDKISKHIRDTGKYNIIEAMFLDKLLKISDKLPERIKKINKHIIKLEYIKENKTHE